MYPYHHFHHGPGRFYRGPRRFIWFFIGAGTAAWFIKHKDERQFGYGWHRQAQQLPPPESHTENYSRAPGHENEKQCRWAHRRELQQSTQPEAQPAPGYSATRHFSTPHLAGIDQTWKNLNCIF